TFSKALAFSFGRFGYGLAAKELVHEIYKVLLPYNLNGFSELAASLLMENSQLLQPAVAAMIVQRKRLSAELKKIPGIETFPTEANFILVKCGFDSRRMVDKLIDRGILVRDVSSYPGLRDHLRISVGTPEENKILLQNILAIADSEYSANGKGREPEK
ncbi:MAG TPA: aminotransferase class I/II-fold pyridoxal phosphate-dependent enzyme, partial [Bacteroidetes bacterium]|nr:aminotransferase class I/II-fold pyridoxal phosphate-dependent enzyme [Bacteroidota bacterium]